VATELLIDIGHSRMKWALAADGQLAPSSIGRAPAERPDRLLDVIDQAGFERVRVSGQSRPERVEDITRRLRAAGAEVDVLTTGDRDLPVAPAYQTLGCDRWLALQWPWLEARRALVVIDCGTAITIDLVDDNGRHRGGWIMAGVEAARAGLSARAPGLNRVLPEAERVDRPARGTGSALVRGSLLMAAGAIERAIDASAETAGAEISAWLTGGDADAIAPLVRRKLRHERHLVLLGLAMAGQAT